MDKGYGQGVDSHDETRYEADDDPNVSYFSTGYGLSRLGPATQYGHTTTTL